MIFSRVRPFVAIIFLFAAAPSPARDDTAVHDLVVRNGSIYDGTGREPYIGDIAVDADRITYVGRPRHLAARTEIDAKGQAVAPGFNQYAGAPRRLAARRWTCLERPHAGRDARSDGRIFDGAPEPENEGADG